MLAVSFYDTSKDFHWLLKIKSEFIESRCEENQDSRFESSSPDAVYRNEKMDDFEDGLIMVIDTKDKEKSRDFGKH
ncbi:hypothetical protein MRB53_032607 [Persea americana]|uniref:Uncharacterized protein n=1 Tax=Persea americana TaxID=3435 RepID=A0ACC2KTE5_PERAE|nr:hypothetical protein MRB53_032607 [Persea americana]